MSADAIDQRPRQSRQLRAVILLTGAILVIEVAGGLRSGSLALLSDAGHLLTDLLALTLSLMACRFASLPANPEKTYGYHRLEILTALVNGSVLILVSGFLAWKAVRRFLAPTPIEGPVMLGVALLGLVANLAGLVMLRGHAHSLNIKGARMHILGDALSSVGVVAASIVIAITGWTRVDPLVAGGIAVVICVGAVRLVRESVDVLLEAAPSGLSLEDVSRAIRDVPGVVEVHDLHVWSITTGLAALSGHVRTDGDGRDGGEALLVRIKTRLRDRFGIVHTTLQIEPPGFRDIGDVHP